MTIYFIDYISIINVHFIAAKKIFEVSLDC